MDDWLKQLQAHFDTAAKVSSDWLTEVSQEAVQVIEEIEIIEEHIEQASAEVFEEIHEAIAPVVSQIDQQVGSRIDASFVFIEQNVEPLVVELTTPIIQTVDDSFDFIDQSVVPWVLETAAPVTKTVNPWLQNHSTCIGCKHYHGTAYGENMLVCGMHPYGPDDASCVDWESVWTSKAN